MILSFPEEDIAGICKAHENPPEVINDLDIPDDVDEIPIANRGEFIAKIDRRIREYKIRVINEPRPFKKLLVLDIDYTLFGEFR